ncbi:MAG TPA: alcohol dehydrogenase catalytic domain-containing protein [Clostridiaceae bacterium]|jgi:L-iditol 2-dehydrogenase|nr:alcohol dehydrogenase catalytic domain-containing protein [Clostridiaceae bacterium]
MIGVVKFKDGKDGWELREIDRPDPKADEVEIEVQAAGICGSELHLYHDNHVYEPPVVVGHEFCGVITRVGEEVKNFKVGDRVVSENNKRTCGVCEFCRTGRAILCRDRKSVGYKVNGGWTKYFCTPEKWLFRLPDHVSFEEGAMTEPISVATQALFVKKTVTIGDIVLVQGCGIIGILNAMVAKVLGADKVIITGTSADEDVRLAIAREVGIDYVVNVETPDLKQFVSELTDGKGVDVIVEASGSDKAIYEMTDLIKKTGNIVVIGETAKKDIPIRWTDLVFKAATLYYSFGAGYEAWSMALYLMEKKLINLKPLVTHRLPLEEFRKGFELLETKKALKVILKP